MARKNDLHKQHAAAHAQGQNALDTFRSVAASLRASAEAHASVESAAQLQINELQGLRDSAATAAQTAARQADAIEALVA